MMISNLLRVKKSKDSPIVKQTNPSYPVFSITKNGQIISYIRERTITPEIYSGDQNEIFYKLLNTASLTIHDYYVIKSLDDLSIPVKELTRYDLKPERLLVPENLTIDDTIDVSFICDTSLPLKTTLTVIKWSKLTTTLYLFASNCGTIQQLTSGCRITLRPETIIKIHLK